MKPEETNVYNRYANDPYTVLFKELLVPAKRPSVYARLDYNVRPSTDNQPFFFHFFTWRQVPMIIQNLGRTWKPFGGSGYLVLVAHLLAAVVIGLLLITLPVAVLQKKAKPRFRVAAYFGLLGIGYLAVEIPVIQQFILFLGNPTIAFAAVVANLLFFSGLGSLMARGIRNRWPFLVLTVCIGLIALLSKPVLDTVIGSSLVIRLMVMSVMLAPAGILMGVPFPLGLAWLERRTPELIPWAWAVNGSLSVITSVGVTMLAMAAGFRVVLLVAVVSYLLAAATLETASSERSAAPSGARK